MAQMSAREYAKARDYPYATICKLCREGKIPALQLGRRFRFDEAEADAALEEIKRSKKRTPREKMLAEKENRRSGVATKAKFDFLAELRKARG